MGSKIPSPHFPTLPAGVPSEGLFQGPPVTHQAPGSRVDGREGEVCALHLPHGAGVQPVVGGHGAVGPDIGAWGGQHQRLQPVAGIRERGSWISKSRLRGGLRGVGLESEERGRKTGEGDRYRCPSK